MSKRFERRAFELRAKSEGKKLAGHAAVFNAETDLGYFREAIKPGAFAESIGKDDIRALFNHDPNLILGRNRANTLTLSEDEVGLYTEIDPPDTQLGRDLVVSVQRGDVSQMSFGFIVLGEEWTKDETNSVLWLRTVTKVQLFDVSPVTFPAYEQTDISARAASARAQEIFDAFCPAAAHLHETERRRAYHQLLTRICA